ncbi:unnamed protein product [Brachionus calyciflorus]|uniref:tRNA (34-2'-O)-methyltransferase regulator WDR6 n=1 Tax=Brachionus calyciflorus TaxID=104777 RepID=A0A813WLK5_9BILA|nr:unnamed protein product [Brachionus calyciflorus]
MSGYFSPVFYKGPIISCEYIDEKKILISYGAYLSLIDECSFEEITKFIALKFRVIHKIVLNKKHPNKICVFGQKALNLITLNNDNTFSNILDKYLELDDWIFDIFWIDSNSNSYLIIVLAHNNCVIYNLNTEVLEKVVQCDQKCMLYSAKILDINSSENPDDLIIASGTIFNEVLLWSLKTGNIFLILKGHQGVIFNIEYSYKTNFLFSTSDDRSINVWKIDMNKQSSELYTRFYGHDARVWQCKPFSKNNIEYLCSIGEDLKCCLWNIDDKTLIYRFDAMRKGSKNIWSLAVNENKMQIVTGWGDGGLRKFELNHYLLQQEDTESFDKNQEISDLDLALENDKDFIRSLILINKRIICCTNLGYLFMIDSLNRSQKLLFKSILLSNFNIIAKNALDHNHWCLAIGTLKGFVYLLNLKFKETEEITIDCINCLGIEEDLKTNDQGSSKINLLTQGSSKIFSLIWLKYENRNFLLVCFSLLNGLIHLYELKNNQLELTSRLFLPVCKQRWLTAAAIININLNNDSDLLEYLHEEIFLIAGDKCGNLHLFKIQIDKSQSENSDSDDFEEEEKNNFKLVKPLESLSNVTKENASISSIYARNLGSSEDDDFLKYSIVCCCKDGFYRVFEFNSSYFTDYEEEEELNDENFSISDEIQKSKKSPQPTKTMLKLINKYQINSYIDLIEEFIFENDERKEFGILRKFSKDEVSENLETSLKLATCFYGDKFMLWNFQLNRCLFESKCGGANRSWDFEFVDKEDNDNLLFRFVYVKNKSISETRKILNKNEIERPISQSSNHLCQKFHGNTITTCKYLKSSKYLLTGAEDTQLIISKITNGNNSVNLIHEFHLQGHDSVVKCIDYYELNENEILLVSAGGKANIKIWKVFLNENSQHNDSINISRITNLYEFKRKLSQSKKNFNNSKNEKPWLYVDLKSNPDIRFMDVCMFRSDLNSDDAILCFACSDGCIR